MLSQSGKAFGQAAVEGRLEVLSEHSVDLFDLSCRAPDGSTLLHLAVRHGHLPPLLRRMEAPHGTALHGVALFKKRCKAAKGSAEPTARLGAHSAARRLCSRRQGNGGAAAGDAGGSVPPGRNSFSSLDSLTLRRDSQ